MLDDLDRAQERLARTLERARSSEDRELAGRVRDEGFQLVHQLNGLLRMSRLHSLDNRAFDGPVRDTSRSLAGLAELLGTLHLVVVDDQIYLNEIRIRVDERGGGGELGPELARHGLGGLRFYTPQSEAELRRLVACFAQAPEAEAPRAALRAALQRDGLTGVEVLGRFRVRLAGEAGAARADPAEALQRAAQATRDAFDNLGQGRMFDPLPARRAVTELLALGLEHEALAFDPPGFAPHVTHALRVCRLALLLGREIGLPQALLQDLGLAGLLHDVGYAEPGAPVDLHSHGAAGARLLLRQRGFHVSKLRRLRAVLGHHAPAQGVRRRPALVARALRIVEDYDTLVRRTGLEPREALARLSGAEAGSYDASLLQAFVNALGACPPGTRATLPDGRAAVVTAPGRGPAGFTRPVVTVAVAAQGGRPAHHERLDLAQAGIDLVRRPAAATPARPERAASAPASPPALEGPLTPCLPIRLLHDARVERRSGRLVFESGAERRALHLVKGELVSAASSRREQTLPSLLLRSEAVDLEQLEWGLAEAARSGRALGRTLVGAGLLDAERLEQALAAQARVVFSDLAAWDEGRWRFVPEAGPQAEEDWSASLSTDALILGAVRALQDPDVVRFALGDLERVLERPAGALPPAAGLLRAPEQALLGLVDGHTPARRLLQLAGLPAAEAQSALLALLAVGLARYRA